MQNDLATCEVVLPSKSVYRAENTVVGSCSRRCGSHIVVATTTVPEIAVQQQYHKGDDQARCEGKLSVLIQNGIEKQQIQQTRGYIHRKSPLFCQTFFFYYNMR